MGSFSILFENNFDMFRLKSENPTRQLVRGIVSVLAGVAIMVYPGLTLKMVIMVMGGLVLVEGIVSYLWSQRSRSTQAPGFYIIPRGIGNMVFGAVLLLFPTFMAEAFVFLIGIILIVAGLSQFMAQLSGFKFGGFSIVYAIISVLALLGGVVLLAKPFESASGLLVFFGAMIALYGIGEIFWALRVRKFMGQNKQVPHTIDAEFEEVD
jgi:uncharacterized membrane protein HdeD (DUF308 family)